VTQIFNSKTVTLLASQAKLVNVQMYKNSGVFGDFYLESQNFLRISEVVYCTQNVSNLSLQLTFTTFFML